MTVQIQGKKLLEEQPRASVSSSTGLDLVSGGAGCLKRLLRLKPDVASIKIRLWLQGLNF